MKQSTISGLKISGVISPSQACSHVRQFDWGYPRAGEPVCDGEPVRWANGEVTKYLSVSVAGKALAFCRWLAPTIDDANAGQTVRARYTRCNVETGEFEALVYGEFAGDVIAKANRICRKLEFHVSQA